MNSTQIPWRALGSRPVVVELSGLWLLASPRDESDLEEGPARARAKAARQAQMAAEEVGGMSRRGPGGSSEKEKGGYGWSFLSHLAVILLNRLQFRVKDVHFAFRDTTNEVHAIVRPASCMLDFWHISSEEKTEN